MAKPKSKFTHYNPPCDIEGCDKLGWAGIEVGPNVPVKARCRDCVMRTNEGYIETGKRAEVGGLPRLAYCCRGGEGSCDGARHDTPR